jgi:hypothetical protein
MPHKKPRRPEPLTAERVELALNRLGCAFTLDGDGDMVSDVDGNTVFFFVEDEGTVLDVRSRWKQALAPDRRGAVLEALDDWHRDELWLRCYTEQDGDDLAVFAECVTDWTAGVNDAQLDQVLNRALDSTLQLFEYLRGLFDV